MNKTMNKLDSLEAQSVYILREAYREFSSLVMLWSIGKDSTVLLWLTRKAFFGHVPFPLVHIDTSYKIPEMIAYRDRLAKEWKLNMIYGQNTEALKAKQTFPDGAIDRLACCKSLSGRTKRRARQATRTVSANPMSPPTNNMRWISAVTGAATAD